MTGYLRRLGSLSMLPLLSVSVALAVAIVLQNPVESARTAVVLGSGILIATLIGYLVGTHGAFRLADTVSSLTQERELAQESLRQSEATFRAMFDGLPSALILADADRRVRLINPAFTRLFGYTLDEVRGRKTDFLYADPADFTRAATRFANRAASDRFEMCYRRRDGTELWCESVGLRLFDHRGQLVGGLAVHNDVTDRRAQEAALLRSLQQAREAHERFSLLFATAPVAMIVGSLDDGRFVETNAAFEALTGYPHASVVGKTSADFDLWPDQAFRQAMHDALRLHGSVLTTESTVRRRSGELLDVAFSGCRVEISGRLHFLTMLVDITAARDARRALERQQEELEEQVAQRTSELETANLTLAERAAAISDLYDNAPCGYHSLAPDGTILAANATELGMLGYARDEFVGRPFTSFLVPDSRAQFRIWGSGTARDLDCDVIRRDGSVLPVLISAVAILDEQGQLVASRATMVDNSEGKARERQIGAMQVELARRADEAEAANRAKSAFLANMSHEIRTPMNAIIGLTHLMSRDAHDPIQHGRLTQVADAASHLLRIINDVLDLSKIDAGKMTLQETDFSLDDVLEGAFGMISGPARQKGLELVLDSGCAPDALRGDPTRLSQALINLLSNAVKFTAEGVIRLGVEVLRDLDQDVLLRFEVRDTGEGIAPEAQAGLFSAFVQVDDSTTRRHGGTGLGLALTRRIAQLMGGEVGVDSRPDAGSRFWFTGWLRKANELAPAAAAEATAGRRALLIEQTAVTRAALENHLGALDVSVESLDDLTAAIAGLATEVGPGGYDVVLLDGAVDLDVVRRRLDRLRDALGSAMPPAILVTATDDDTCRAAAVAIGFAAVLVRPISRSALRRTLVHVLGVTQDEIQVAPSPRIGEMEGWLRTNRPGRRVLVAEDNRVSRHVAIEMLQLAGLLVDTATNGREAAEMALARDYEAVLMDMQMPEVDGLEATHRIRTGGRTTLPIIAMTANAFGEDRLACLAAGMNDHLPKPVDPEVLYAKLARWISSPT